MTAWFTLAASVLLLPTLFTVLDLFGGLRAKHKHVLDPNGVAVEDFEVLVPIYGSMKYLENAEFLAPYGSRVVLCTTASESAEFERDLEAVIARYGFRVFRAAVERNVSVKGGRATSGTVRDRIIRDAHKVLTAPWVVCLDADTVTELTLGQLVGSMTSQNLDLVSVRLVPSNHDSLLARLQAHEYRVAMLLRRIMPWMVSGACHAGRREAHRRVMARHSLFFQGNDIEVGLLADRLGYRVGHIPMAVPTTVPHTFKPWLRQRLAWAGGEVRLFVANPQIALRHPFFWTYGAVVTILAFPLRWKAVAAPTMPLLLVPAVYVALSLYIHRGHLDRWLLLMPFYAAFSSLIITPLGLAYYVRMAVTDRNAGLIRTKARVAAHRDSLSRRRPNGRAGTFQPAVARRSS